MNLEEFIKLQELERNKSKQRRTTSQNFNMELTHLWNSNSEEEWNIALEQYWELVKPANISLENKMETLSPNYIRNLTAEGFYEFLYDEYFVWKYTAKNRLATTHMHLQRYITEKRVNDLDRIREELFSFDLENIKKGLEIASSIHGLGIAGASGLLALLFPKYFGTVDQFVVLDLMSIRDINQIDLIKLMNPDNLRLKDGVELIKIMKERAGELNRMNNTDKWTPRHIDKVLWAYRS